ncbi:MAG: FAD:protein FMN transferase [Burkholderiales bacterium]|nr:FAD:protein FMN transferase [Burkholderiales bacterium]
MLQTTLHTAAKAVRPAAKAQGSWMRREQAIMGTAVSVQLWADNRIRGEAAIAAVMAEMQRIDRAMSPHRRDSELSRINREAALRPVRLSEEMHRLIARAIGFSQLSRGAFDITYASAGALYDYRAGIAPDAPTLERAVAAIGWQNLRIDLATRSLRFAKPGMRIDLGGFAKGHAVDTSCAILARFGIRHAIVTAGGDSRVIGDRRGAPWTIAIRDPRQADGIVAMLPLEDVAISTSGDYERYFERDGVRHHHLIDPRTGRSPDQVRSVTILAADGLTAEALSKTVFVRGVEAGMRIVESVPGADAVAVDADGALHFSSGLLNLIRKGQP